MPSKTGTLRGARSERLSQVYPLGALEASVFLHSGTHVLQAQRAPGCLTTEVERFVRALGRAPVTDRSAAPKEL